LSYRCLVYLVKDGNVVKNKFESDFREAQISGRRGVVVVFRASRVSEVIPYVRDVLLNNIVMGVAMVMVSDFRSSEVLEALRNELLARKVADAKVVYEDSYADEAERVVNVLKSLSIPVVIEKV